MYPIGSNTGQQSETRKKVGEEENPQNKNIKNIFENTFSGFSGSGEQKKVVGSGNQPPSYGTPPVNMFQQTPPPVNMYQPSVNSNNPVYLYNNLKPPVSSETRKVVGTVNQPPFYGIPPVNMYQPNNQPPVNMYQPPVNMYQPPVNKYDNVPQSHPNIYDAKHSSTPNIFDRPSNPEEEGKKVVGGGGKQTPQSQEERKKVPS